MTAIDLGGSYMKYLVGLVEREDQFYDSLLEVLATTIFVSITPNDENRIEDGLALRNEYLERAESHEHIPNWGECSVLEVMIALSRHMENMCWDPDSEDAKASYWFWVMVDNLGLSEYYDYREFGIHDEIEDIREILNVFINRNYDHNGSGGLFPLGYPERDQTEVELWYQMQSFMAEIMHN